MQIDAIDANCIYLESVRAKSGELRTPSGKTYYTWEDYPHHERVVIILKWGLEKSLLEWKPVNSRLITAKPIGQ